MLTENQTVVVSDKHGRNSSTATRRVTMGSILVSFRNVEGSSATLGWAGSHTVIADGGLGLGFRGGELLALSIGCCYCNNIRSIAEELNVSVGKLHVDVTLEYEGDPAKVTGAALSFLCTTLDGTDPDILTQRAIETCSVANSLRDGFPVDFVKT
jgi:organic hydroperoxide reductase OsmC/OhrA